MSWGWAMSSLAPLAERAAGELSACTDEASLRAWHTKYFGKQGEVQEALDRLKTLPPTERAAGTRRKRNLTPEGRKRIADAMKRRWAEPRRRHWPRV